MYTRTADEGPHVDVEGGQGQDDEPVEVGFRDPSGEVDQGRGGIDEPEARGDRPGQAVHPAPPEGGQDDNGADLEHGVPQGVAVDEADQDQDRGVGDQHAVDQPVTGLELLVVDDPTVGDMVA